MKRILCLLIAVLMLMSVGVMSVGAEEAIPENLKQGFFDYFREPNKKMEDIVILDYSEIDDCVFFYGYLAPFALEDMSYQKVVGDYFIIGQMLFRYIDDSYDFDAATYSGFHVMVDGVVYDIKDAYEQGIVTDISPIAELDTVGPNYTGGTAAILMGDVDIDGKLTIKDATAIQKYLAGMLEHWTGNVQMSISDINLDDDTNIRDATAIQKKLAGIAE